ncbi:MAG: N-acetylmuramoyl-L-alanine amidase [Chryseobacterium sp.]|nr:MAG: N-acetylmuramoyl-L-alanine amidase [Chryseobacterium sp.]
MRNIKNIILHCTAGGQFQKTVDIQNYWRKELGWKNPGYHYIINADGTVEILLSIDKISNGVAGFNSESINISYKGGVDGKGKAIDNRTPQQIASQIKLIKELRIKFPKAKIRGHRDFPNVTKACPSFDVKTWCKSVGIDPL